MGQYSTALGIYLGKKSDSMETESSSHGCGVAQKPEDIRTYTETHTYTRIHIYIYI